MDALREITSAMGAKLWGFDEDSCKIREFGVTQDTPEGAQRSVDCSCAVGNDTFCHVVRMYRSLISSSLESFFLVNTVDLRKTSDQ